MSTFKPSGFDRLREVDTAKCNYGKEVVEIEGVVSHRVQGGMRHGKCLVHSFALAAWRQPGQPIVQSELTVLRPVDPERDWLREFPPLSIHRFQVLLATDDARAILVAPGTAPANPRGLQKIANELNKPLIVETERFGQLWLNDSLNCFEGGADWNGEEIEVSFEAKSGYDISSALNVAEKLWRAPRKWKKLVDDYAVQELLPLKNRSWLDDGEKPVTAKQFKERMSLNSITFHADGSFDFWHDDGDLFLEHSILISGTLDGFTKADIPG